VSPGSQLINLDLQEAMLKQLFDNQILELKILYRGTEHSFAYAAFLDNCVNKGPTLSVFQSENGRIFGGYTSKNWIKFDKGVGYYFFTSDEKAWLFSFDH
jgi:hypothetical protein